MSTHVKFYIDVFEIFVFNFYNNQINQYMFSKLKFNQNRILLPHK